MPGSRVRYQPVHGDQRDPRAYAVIAAAAPTMATPEQAAIWAYPQPTFSDEQIALTMVNAMLSRIHLSGRIDLLAGPQFAPVEDAVDCLYPRMMPGAYTYDAAAGGLRVKLPEQHTARLLRLHHRGET